MPNEMTPLKAAEKLDKLLFFWKYTCKKDDGILNYIKAVDTAATYLRAIATGEYKRVVHAHWKEVEPGHDVLFECSRCGRIISSSWGSCEDDDTHGNNGCDPTEEWLTCPTCGARMDGEAISDDA